MKHLLLLLTAAVIPAVALGQAPSPSITPSQLQEEVRRAEDARRDAILRNDTAALAQLIADSYLGTLGGGRLVTKAEELAVNRTTARRVAAWHASDVVVRVYGTAAVVTGLATVRDTLRGEARQSRSGSRTSGSRLIAAGNWSPGTTVGEPKARGETAAGTIVTGPVFFEA